MNSLDLKNANQVQPPRPSLRRTYHLIFAALIVVVLAQLAIAIWSNGIKQAVAASQQRRYESHLIASELRQCSDDLTRMARSFASSGDPMFEQFYHDIIAIRDGRQPRPNDYDKVYWELAVAMRRQPPAIGPASSLEKRMQAAGFTTAELAKLREGYRQSDALVRLELIAMNAVKGAYSDANGQFTLRSAPNRAYAFQLLHGTEYQLAKARIMKPIRDVQVMLDQRTGAEVRRLSAQAASLAGLETSLLIAAIVFVALAFLILNRRIIAPLMELTAAAAGVGRNGFFRRVLVSRNDELGTLAGALNRMSETVEQKTSELAASEERFRGLLEALPDALVLTDAAGKVTFANWQTESLLGYARAELVGQPVVALLPDLAHRAASPTPGASRELTVRRKDDVEVPIEVSFHPLTAPDGSEWLCGVIRDVTARKAAEADLRRGQQLTQAIMDNANAFIYVKDTQGNYLFVNHNYETLLGRPAAELLGRSASDLFGRKAGAAHEEGDREVRRTRESYEREETAELNGVIRCLHSRKFPLVNERGELYGTAGVFTDFTEIKLAREELAAAKAAASAVAVAGSHLATLHHEASPPQNTAADLEGETGTTPVSEDVGADELQTNGEVPSLAEAVSTPATSQVEEVPLADIDEPTPSPDRSTDFPTGDPGEPTSLLTGSETGAPVPAAESKPERKKRVRKPKAEVESGISVAPVSGGVTHDAMTTPSWETATSEGVPAIEPPVATDHPVEEVEIEGRAGMAPVAQDVVTDELLTAADAPAVFETSSATSASQLWEGAADESEETGAPSEVADSAEPTAPDATASEPGSVTEPKPEKKKRARKKKDADGTQPDLFGDYDATKDDAGPVVITVDPDGVPLVPGLDLREAMNRLGLPLASIRTQAVRFGGSLGQTCQDLRTALAGQDNDAARQHAHALAGTAGNLSADTLRRLAKTLELALKFEQGDTQTMVADLEREAARVAEGIRQLNALPEDPPIAASDSAASAEPIRTAAPADTRKLHTALEELAAALEESDFDAIRQQAAKLKGIALPTAFEADYECLSEMVDNFDYAEAAVVVRAMQERIA